VAVTRVAVAGWQWQFCQWQGGSGKMAVKKRWQWQGWQWKKGGGSGNMAVTHRVAVVYDGSQNCVSVCLECMGMDEIHMEK
jgi:hypothetical protein